VTAVLVDAGPLIALLDRGDPHHERCTAALRSLSDPLISVWPVVTKALYLLGFSWQAQDGLWDLLASEAIALAPLDHADAPRMRELMSKYRDLPMDLADAALVRVAERERLRRVFTLDRRHFDLYRPARLGRFEILP
jgi:predicted nucleic acid-binding protein